MQWEQHERQLWGCGEDNKQKNQPVKSGSKPSHWWKCAYNESHSTTKHSYYKSHYSFNTNSSHSPKYSSTDTDFTCGYYLPLQQLPKLQSLCNRPQQKQNLLDLKLYWQVLP
jgi:hypothetical protein